MSNSQLIPKVHFSMVRSFLSFKIMTWDPDSILSTARPNRSKSYQGKISQKTKLLLTILAEFYIFKSQSASKVPYKEKEIEKKYFTIGEVADELRVATSLIRFWESEFDIIKPKKNRKGNRQFTKEDIKNVKLIYHLVKEKGYTLQGARDFIKNDVDVASDKIELIESLKRIKGFLQKLREDLPE